MTDNPYEKYYREAQNPPRSNSAEYNGENQQNFSYNVPQPSMWEENPATTPYEPAKVENPTVPEYVPTEEIVVPVVSSEEPKRDEHFSDVSEPSSNQASAVSYEWYGSNSPVSEVREEYTAPAEERDYKEKISSKDKARMPVALLLLICMVVSAVFGGGSAFVVNHFINKNNTSSSSSGLTINQVTPDSGDEGYSAAGEISTVDIVEKSADSVVEIVTETVTTGVFSQQYIQSGAGSGVIIDSEGYIVTNHHVIEGARKISVTLRNGKTHSAKLIGSDAKEDLALLKIDVEGLVSAVIGDSDTLRVGQRTIAIGNPLGQLGGTVTEGIISALDRELVVDGQSMNLLQTDTAINPGNSGGGMFDGKGNLIGIVVAKSSGSEVEGLGFAIPINDALVVISDLMEYGYVRGRVEIGVEFIDVTSEAVAWMYGLSETGCYVYEVGRGTNAEEAGFKSGDLVKTVDGKEIFNSDDIEEILNKKQVGDVVEFSVIRGRSIEKLSLVLEEETPDTFTNSDSDSNSIIPWYNFG